LERSIQSCVPEQASPLVFSGIPLNLYNDPHPVSPDDLSVSSSRKVMRILKKSTTRRCYRYFD